MLINSSFSASFSHASVLEEEDGDNDEGSSSAYRLKYERVARELEFTKKRLQTQHEHDLEQLVGLKKQLEKKLADAYEEVEEQRQVVAQWKRKNQKMTNEMNDLRMLLEEQNSRNNLLEKRQRKFDSECQALQVNLNQRSPPTPCDFNLIFRMQPDKKDKRRIDFHVKKTFSSLKSSN